MKDISQTSKLCPPCDVWWKDYSRKQQRQLSQDRQQQARDQSHNQNRNMGSPSLNETENTGNVDPTCEISGRNGYFQGSLTSAHSAGPPPDVDIARLHSSYNQFKATGAESAVLKDMFALMINIHSRQTEIDSLKVNLEHTNKRLDAVKAKIGSCDEVAERLGLAVTNLPLPTGGVTDLDIVKQVFALIRVGGLDLNRDIIKAVRKFPSKSIPHSSQPPLGTVLVEMRDEESRKKIMLNKYILQQHPDPSVKSIKI